jgi:hypothetical protein
MPCSSDRRQDILEVNWDSKVRTLVALFQFIAFSAFAQPIFKKSNLKEPDVLHLKTVGKVALPQTGFRVYISLSEVCMLSRYYARVFEKMRHRFPEMTWIGVFPNPFSNDSTIKLFASRNNLKFTFCRDSLAIFSKSVDWTVTPEALVLGPENSILFKGRIDDFYVAIGRHKTKTSQHFLQTALASIQKGQAPEKPFVPPLGCIIDFRLWDPDLKSE